MVKIIDTTLREGEQTPGLHLSLALKKKIVKGLSRIGVDEIEIGMASPAAPDVDALHAFARSSLPKQSLALWCRCRPDDIRQAALLGPDVLALSIPASDLHLRKKFGKERLWALEQVAASIALARSLGLSKVALGLEDGTRADHDFLLELAHTARHAGAFRIRLADTVGIADPALIAELVTLLAGSGLEVAVHCHNDFGMATANTISAFNNGAGWGDVTILGLGERAGNSRLEEVVSYLALRKGQSGYDLQELVGLSRLVAEATGRAIASNQPLLGSAIFACGSGIHQQGLLADPATYEPFDPQLVGRRRSLQVGAGVGRHGLRAVLERLHLPCRSDSDLHHLWQRIRDEATLLRRPLDDHEISRLALGIGG